MSSSNNICKVYLKIHYPPPYEREIWHYDQANVDHIRIVVDLFPWGKTLRNLNIKLLRILFNKTVKNIISNYILHETVTFDDRDPPWINKNVNSKVYKKYVNENKDPGIFGKVICLQNELNSIIESNKQKYYSRLSKKLVDPMTSTKSYWLTLKVFLNNKKIPCIPPLRHQKKYVTDFKEKAVIFNSLL